MASLNSDNSNKFPRNKKRESNGRGGSDNGNSRKPPPQKWRSAGDKRPRSRTSNTFDRQREEVVQSYQEEYGSMYGPKKGNLNHLLNFSFAPREVDAFVGGNVKRTKTNRVRFDKKRFLQANCQFIVKDTGDYSLHTADPDILVDWNLVELVRLYSHNEPACPICMDTPVAAKVTRCGHIYCWSCILHLLSLEDGSWAECPICYSPVLAKDLRSAESVIIKSYKIGDIITMKLMKRECGTNYSVPKDIWSDRQGKLHRYLEDINITKYMKLLAASASEILQHVVDREKTSLQTQLIDTEDSEVCFIETALAQLQEREKDLVMQALVETSFNKFDKMAQRKGDTKTDDKIKATASLTGDIDRRVKTLSVGSTTSDEYPEITAGRFKTFSESSVSDIEGALESCSDMPTSQSVPSDLGACAAEMIEDVTISEESYTEPEMSTDMMNTNIHKPKNKRVYVSKNGYHCFQAEDGQQIYIHNLNSRCLTHEYGSLEQSPASITARIIDIRTMNMSEELRSRTKYLNHLPLSSEFQQVELDLKPPIVSRPTLDLFHSEIDRKKKSRIRKEKSERQREKQISLEEDKRMGKYPELNISLKSEYQFPSHINSYNDHPVLSVQSQSVSVDSPVSPDITTPSPPDDRQSLSFAQMLRNGPTKSPVQAWPKLQSKASSSPVVKEEKTTVYIDSDGEELEDYTPVPEFKQSFGNALQAALDSATAKSESKSAGKQKDGKKKKNKKVKLLFSTSMSRGATE
ncbi:hypothetical protein LOTGIDRAFT_228391 [Lottia gigantea]|uniref:E3 ubiquitin-protein ligase RNF10 n=1 Tax=Lottia gigantea TaxID=225164 RepID=V4C829_LOTGI|nr:hypothetical protein LOTGIDRAFT_228391 [Lottia gigantea]ESO97849.1 hypothetical protein LOTGIDRAFT_228391 [Lottia gigantea]